MLFYDYYKIQDIRQFLFLIPDMYLGTITSTNQDYCNFIMIASHGARHVDIKKKTTKLTIICRLYRDVAIVTCSSLDNSCSIFDITYGNIKESDCVYSSSAWHLKAVSICIAVSVSLTHIYTYNSARVCVCCHGIHPFIWTTFPPNYTLHDMANTYCSRRSNFLFLY